MQITIGKLPEGKITYCLLHDWIKEDYSRDSRTGTTYSKDDKNFNDEDLVKLRRCWFCKR